TAENLARNLPQLAELRAVAEELEVSTGQLALAWLRAKGDDILPIPGTRSVAHMRENLAAEALRLAPATVTRLDAVLSPDRVAGERYGTGLQAEIDTEAFNLA
ncbi:aldo/keto reductase, partial [Halomonas sp. BM-2019]|uniref:aldo/keto reductase n=1 Tax=Halomonas sp. BM-2019 TaxID=2811227 RepID=UPI001B3C4508